MLKTRLVVLSSLALLAMLVGLVACGGGTSGLIDVDLSADDTYMGITGGDFKVVRSNDAGYRDSALNRTLDLQSVSTGNVTTVTISVNDTDPMYGVTLELSYDPGKYNPLNVEFNGLVDNPLELAVTTVNGVVGAGQVDVNGRALRSGEFVTVTFANEPSIVNKSVSAVHDFPINQLYEPGTITAATGAMGWEYTEPANPGDPGLYKFRATFGVGDGSSDGETGVGDLTPMVAHGYFDNQNVEDADYAPATADYNGDGRVTVADITTIGQNFLAYYNRIELAIGPDGTFEAGDTPLATIGFGDSEEHTLPAAAGTVDWDAIFRTWLGEVADADIQANAAGDGSYWLAARLSDGTDVGDWTIMGPYTGGPPPPAEFVVDAYGVRLTGATGGTGSEGADHFVDGDTIMAPANSDLGLEVFQIAGTYEGAPFVGDDGTAPTAEYDAALASAQALVSWTPSSSNEPGFWKTSEVLVITDSTATVFPDDDVEPDDEGALEVTMAESGTFVPGAISYNFDVDVTDDEAAPEVMVIASSAGEAGAWLIDRVAQTSLVYSFDFGTGGVPGDLSTVGAALYDLDDNAEALAFTYSPDPPLVNEFTIIDNPGPESSHIALLELGAGNAVSGHTYTVRLMDGVYNSVNKPGEYLTLAPPPPAVTFRVLPVDGNVNPDDDHLWIFYPDPIIRRNPRATYNIVTDEVVPEDPDGYTDVIRQGLMNGGEFFYENVGGLHPDTIIMEDTVPSSIGPNDATMPGVIRSMTCPGYLVLDIAVLTTGTGTEDRNFGFAVFSADDTRLGGGTFVVHPDPFIPPAPGAVDWGINAFSDVERGDLDLPDYTNHLLDADTVGNNGLPFATPDVLFVEFGAGIVAHFDEVQADAPNIMIRLHSDTEGDLDLFWDPRMVMAAGGAMIVVHGFKPLDFDVPGSPGVGGPLDIGVGTFDVQLVDPTGTIVYETLAGPLSIVGTNPNLP